MFFIVKDILSTPRQRGSPDASGRTLAALFGFTFAPEARGYWIGLILPKSLLSLWSSVSWFQNKKYFCFVKDIHEYAARRRLLGRSPDAPQTLQDAPWRCFWGSHLLRRPLGMHHIVKVLMKFAVFRFLFHKNDLVVVFLGAGSLLKTKRS